jgi:hypothetical protein
VQEASIGAKPTVCLQSIRGALQCLSDETERPGALQVVGDAFEGIFNPPFRTMYFLDGTFIH